MEPDQIIDCIDCGGRCHLTTTWEHGERPYPGDVLTYRCEDCNDMWYLVVPEDAEDDDHRY